MRAYLVAIAVVLLMPAAALAQDGLEKIITLTARDSEIRDLVQSVARLANVNVIVDPKIRGKMPVNLKDITAADAFKLLAGITGNKVGMIDGVVIFATEETMKFMQGPARNVTYQLRYAKAEEVGAIINKVFPKDAQAIHHGPTNKVIITTK
jgi:type II secretory pathway component GspD/PulD (secretin)